MEQVIRPRRLRTNRTMRELVRETRVSPNAIVYPIFVKEGRGIVEEIPSMEGQYRYSPDMLPKVLESCQNSGINKVLLFGIPQSKDEVGSSAYDENGIVQQAIKTAKKNFPDLMVLTDVCLCEYTSHGHCGVLCGQSVDNDKTLELLTKTALSHAYAGADMVAPSDMMDGRIRAIRQGLDEKGFINTGIMSYAAKYASSFFGPFREAAGSAPSFGDRKSYQMDYHNAKEAMKEAALDALEGADILMVKPALSYLDVILKASQSFHLPIAAYSVSGEYSMIKAASKAGFMDEASLICETAVSVFRAGANILITYYAMELARFIEEGRIG